MITEPSTLATDYALAALSAWCGWRLRGQARHAGQRSTGLWSWALMATSIGSFAGGTYHGFATMLPEPVAAVTWTITTITVGAAACLMLSAVIAASVGRAAGRVLLVVVWLEFVAYAMWMLGHDAFLYVIIQYGSAMLVTLILLWLPGGLRGKVARGWITAGIGVTLAAAGIQQSGFDLHRHFNHNDLQHIVQMFGVWLLYKGGTRLQDVVNAPWR